ncbi:Domain of unknown function DUF83 [Ruminococcus sp. SR1/5]|nr:Domain of unknown function DUF83 [Ruminococcus sp. SR1/5]
MEYTEDDYLMISGIQHFKFCRRQWALIHVEQQWAENVHTAVGKLMHQKVHDPYLTEKRKDTILVRALPVSSRIMGVSGECDLVEFHKCEDGIRLHGHRGMYSVYPVEYKKEKKNQQMPIDCSLWHRFYVSKKCFLQQYLKQLFFMEKQDEEKLWKLQRI